MSSVGHPTPTLRVIECFAGIGGLSLGVQRGARAVGIEARTDLYVEIEAFPAAVLAHEIAQARLAPAPVFMGDLRKLDAAPWAGEFDLLCGGFPCQDLSYAGKGAGLAGARSGLWFDMLDLACDLRVPYLFVENVAAIVNRGMPAVLGSLAERGFDAQWTCLRASDVGAPHRRDRWFLLACRVGVDGDGRGDVGAGGRQEPPDRGEHVADSSSRRLEEHTQRDGRPQRGVEAGQLGNDAVRRGTDVADAERLGGSGRGEPCNVARAPGEAQGQEAQRQRGRAPADDRTGGLPGPAVADDDARSQGRGVRERGRADERSAGQGGGTLPQYPPGPADLTGWLDIFGRLGRTDLAPAVAVRKAGQPAAQSQVRTLADGSLTRVDELRAVGNSVVPNQAAVAFEILWRRAHERDNT